MLLDFEIYDKKLNELPNKTLVINTINAHSYNVARSNVDFYNVLMQSDVLLPDGISVVWAAKILNAVKTRRASSNFKTKTRHASSLRKIAGEDLFYYEMNRLSVMKSPTALFLGSTESVLEKIRTRASVEFPNVTIHTYSPPYKAIFSKDDNDAMIMVINTVKPDVLFVGMTAPKQEKWVNKMVNDKLLILDNCHICCIGAVFDFYAGTVSRAPRWMIRLGLEWFYRLVKEPRRMWRRYLVGNVKFVTAIISEVFSIKPNK